MPSFNYKAKTSTGNVVSGRFDATDKSMVVSLLRGKGYFPLDITQISAINKEVRLSSLKKVTTKNLAVFCRQFHTMINAGVSVLGCMDMLRRQTENPRLAMVLSKVYDEVQKGRTLSESMKLHTSVFPLILISMIEVGEVSGTLDSTMEKLAVHFEKDNKINQKIKTAMAYPAVIGCIALLMVGFMMTFVVPRFLSMFKSMGETLPLPTRILLNISNTISNVWFLLGTIAGLFAVIYVFNKIKKLPIVKLWFDNAVLRLPLAGKNVRKILASRFTRTLSSLLSTGVSLIQALEVVEKVVDNQIVTQGMAKVKEDIKRGSNLAGPLEGIGIFPVMVTHMISVGEESGSLDAIMEKAADFYDDELDASISQLISLLEPIMILFMALIVGFIVISMILPIFQMYGNIGTK